MLREIRKGGMDLSNMSQMAQKAKNLTALCKQTI
jgi:hypothetical protein